VTSYRIHIHPDHAELLRKRLREAMDHAARNVEAEAWYRSARSAPRGGRSVSPGNPRPSPANILLSADYLAVSHVPYVATAARAFRHAWNRPALHHKATQTLQRRIARALADHTLREAAPRQGENPC
jgi:hypothetical protein